MPRLKVRFDGWLALPAAFRRQLGVEPGDELEAELVGGTVVLRPVRGRAGAGEPGAESVHDPAPATPAASPPAAGPDRGRARATRPGAHSGVKVGGRRKAK